MTFNLARHLIGCGRARDRAFVDRDRGYTYDELGVLVSSAAARLRAVGVEREQRVALLLPDSIDLVVGFLGALWAGAVPVPINLAYSTEDVRFILDDCRAKVVVTDEAGKPRVGAGRPILHGDDLRGPGSMDPAPTCKDEAAFFLYTSGSTGRPKGVVHAHQSPLVSAESYGSRVLGLCRSDVVFSVAKIPFAYGLGNTLYMSMSAGATAVLTDATNAFQIIDDIHRHRPTVLFAIPATYAAILSLKSIAPLDASSLRLCVSAAEQLSSTIFASWKELFDLEICEGIGTTELGHVFISNVPGACRPGWSGKPVPGYRVRIVDGSGADVRAGEVGDLEVAGESLMLGYWNRLSDTRKALFGGAMRTGDKYVCNEDGFYKFMGRGDDLFKVNGQWVEPLEIEDVLRAHPSVADCAISPLRDGATALLVAHVVVTPGTNETELGETLRAHARRSLPAFKVPRRIVFAGALPRNATGKVDRKALRA